MVLQVAAHLAYVGHDVEAVTAQLVSVADAGEHEHLRGVAGAGADDHLLLAGVGVPSAAVADDDSGRHAAVDQHLLDEGPGGERQVRPPERRAQVRARVVRTFRSRSDSYLNDPVAIEMVDALSRRSTRFKALWDAHDVRRADTDTLEAVLPGGRLVLTLVTLQGVTSPAIRFNAYLPADTATAALLVTGEPGTRAAS